ncbi:hypothetical protein ACFQ0M_05955 [Kitasatospora aburaviensis]
MRGFAELAHELLLLPSASRTAFLEELYGFMGGLNRRAVEAVAPSGRPAATGTTVTEAEAKAEREAERLLAALAWQLWRVVGTAARAGTAVGTGTGSAPALAAAPVPAGVRPGGVRPGGEGATADRAPGGGPADDGSGGGRQSAAAAAGVSAGPAATDGADTTDSVYTDPPAEPTGSTGSTDPTGPADPTDEEPAEQAGPAPSSEEPSSEEPSSEEPPSEEAPLEEAPLAAFTARLAAVAAAHPDLRNDTELRNDTDSTDPAGLWLRLHLAVLKIPAERVAARRAELAEAALLLDEVVEGARTCSSRPCRGCSRRRSSSRWTYRVGEPAEADRVELRAVLDDAEVPEQEEERVLPWAVRIAQARRLLAVDRTLGGYAENNVPWSRAQAERLPQAWTAKLSSLSKVRGATTVARSAQKLDATLGRLCHEDPAHRGSWWWEWRSRVSALLEAPAAALGRRAASPEEIADWSMEYWTRWCTGNAVHRGDQARTVLWVLTTPLAPPTDASERGRLLLGHAPTGR